MQILSIRQIGSIGYWLASREYNNGGAIRYEPNWGNAGTKGLWGTNGFAGNHSMGFRPVFLINPTAQIDSGSGTEADPYILKAGN